MKVYITGRFYEKADATISVFDHGFLFGDGVFEGMRSYNGKVFRLKEHIDRLWNSAKGVMIEVPLSKDEMIAAVNEALRINEISDGYVRLIVTRGIGTLGLDAHLCENPQIVIITDHLKLYPAEYYEKGLEIITASTIRSNPAALSPQIKSLNYLNNIMAKIEGHLAGCVEALMLNAKGEVAEATGDNIFIVTRGMLWTPPTDAGILEGITRQAVIDIAKECGVPVKQTPMTRQDIFSADECFLTGSAAELIPIIKLDGRTIGDGKPGRLTLQLLESFQAETRK